MTIPSLLFHQLRLRLRPRLPAYTTNNDARRPRPTPSQCHHAAVGVATPRRHGIVTSSVPPSPNVFIERPEVVVLAESSLYDRSWNNFSTSFFPSMGMHFASIDIMRPTNSSGKSRKGKGGAGAGKVGSAAATLKSLERTMAEDLSRLGDSTDPYADMYVPGAAPPTSSNSAHVVLIARGPLQCLVAQYFLESLPLAGLVLVDPLLLAEDGRAGRPRKTNSGEGEKSRWEASVSDLVSMLDKNAPGQGSSSSDSELSLLRSLANNSKGEGGARPLRLEPGSVPTLVCYSGDGEDDLASNRRRVCAERTAAFHTCGGKGDHFDQVSVLKVPIKGSGGGAVDDLDRWGRTVYEWYDEAVA